MIDHSVIFSAAYLHLQHPFHLPSRLIEKIRIGIGILGDQHGPVRINALHTGSKSKFIHILEDPYGNSAVYDIFTVVAGIIPAAGNIDGSGIARIAPYAQNGSIIRVMSRGPCERLGRAAARNRKG